MTEAERLAERTPERIWLIDMGDCIAWCDDPDPSGTGEDDAVEYVQSALLRSQAEELERLREFVRYIEETSDDEHEVRKARAALGER